jgi:hypothetical protein
VLRATIIGFLRRSRCCRHELATLIRPYMVARSEQLSGASVFATIVMERALDIIVVLTLLASFVWVSTAGRFCRRRAGADPGVGRAGRRIVVVLMAVMWTLATHPERIERLVASSDRVLRARVAHTLARLARTFSEGFAVHGSRATSRSRSSGRFRCG